VKHTNAFASFLGAAALCCMFVIGSVAPAAAADIVDTAISAGNFQTLVAAVQAAGLVDALRGTGPFTVFAPTDEAFAKLPVKKLGDLLLPENKGLLTSILLYHVVAGKVMAADVVNLEEATTLNGEDVRIAVTGKGVRINNANVIATDIETSNGVIHVIDRVLIPRADGQGDQ